MKDKGLWKSARLENSASTQSCLWVMPSSPNGMRQIYITFLRVKWWKVNCTFSFNNFHFLFTILAKKASSKSFEKNIFPQVKVTTRHSSSMSLGAENTPGIGLKAGNKLDWILQKFSTATKWQKVFPFVSRGQSLLDKEYYFLGGRNIAMHFLLFVNQYLGSLFVWETSDFLV